MPNAPSTSPARTENREELILRKVREQALKEAATVGEFRTGFHARVDQLVTKGTMGKSGNDGAALEQYTLIDRAKLQGLMRTQEAIVRDATNDHDEMRIEEMEPGKLGYNRLGAGKAGAALSRDMFERMEGEEDARSIRQVAAHEAAHGEQKQLRGGLMIDGKEIDHLHILEGHAEISGNEAIGRDANFHREGQPQQVYKEGQEIVRTLIAQTSRESVERVLTRSGDLRELQEELAEKKNAGLAPGQKIAA